MDKTVTIASFDNNIDARIAMGKLQNENIICSLENENIISTNWLWGNAIGGIKVKVFEKDAKKAYDILNQPESDETIVCPNCKSTNVKELMFERRFMGSLNIFFTSTTFAE